MIWHSTSPAEVTAELQVDSQKGLPNGVADMRLEQYGHNIISKIEKPSFIKCFLKQLKSKTSVVLIVLSLLSFLVSLLYREGNAASPLLIVAIVLLNALISAYYIYSCGISLEQMKTISHSDVSVLRDGIVKKINSALLVPGDIILLSAGDYIPADARILEAEEFRCNELVLTETDVPVEKNGESVVEDITPVAERVNMVFYGCSVVHGSAKAVVVSTGLHTELGKTSAILQQTGGDTLPLEGELDLIGKTVNIAILLICLLMFLIGMIQNFSTGMFASMTLKMLVNAMALAVAAIPEGLPAIATIVIAIGLQRIVQNKITVKEISALELLGRTDLICTDKTGILTKNTMKVSKIFDGERLTALDSEQPDEKAALILKLAAACSTLSNDSTEAAIEKACLSYNAMSVSDVQNLFPKLAGIPFDSERKTMSVITMIHEKPFAIVKGAPELVIPNCIGSKAEEALKMNDSMADEGYRVVCLAMKPLTEIPANPKPDEIENELTFVGLIGLSDPPRDDVVTDLELCDKAGIRTVMITGDHLMTARSIARRIGILKDGTEAITGSELSALSDEELEEKIECYSVYARITPNDKLRIVKAWQKHKKIVTVTGDSLQDADTLAAADVGCAMGKYGADTAKGNAGIVISNNRFHSIVCAIQESRGLFENIRKSVYYLFSCNLGEILFVLAGMLIFNKMPLAAAPLLWINLLTDCAPAISLSMERAEDLVMSKKPISSVFKIFDAVSVCRILTEAVLIAIITLISYSIGNEYGSTTAMTMAFVTLGAAQIFDCFNHKLAGTLFNKSVFSNRFMNLSAVLTLFIVLFLVMTPAGYVFGMTLLSWKQLLISVLLAVSVFPVSELVKLGMRFLREKTN